MDRDVKRPSGWILIMALLTGMLPPAGFCVESTSEAVEKPAGVSIPAGATVEELFVDFLHYARLGRFTAADAYAKALLAHPELDPLRVLNIANKDRKSLDTLLIIVRNSTVGDRARRVVDLIEKGESLRRQDAQRIKANIDWLGGDPQQEYIAGGRLIESGEYAVPQILQNLLDDSRTRLWPRLLTALPKIGKGALNPLVTSLAMSNDNVRLHVIRALGEIGYPQAIPYLLELTVNPSVPSQSKEAALQAVLRIEQITGRTFPGAPDDHYFRLAERYYNEDDTVRANPRLPQANLWYWDASSQSLNQVVVSERLFGPLMAMRCCERALTLRGDNAEAQSLWLAANIRREGRLGLNIESGDPMERGQSDPTRPEDFPRALYFTQAAGPRFAHRVLQRAVVDRDAAVALGAVEALRVTAGESSMVGFEDVKLPLVQALKFPDLLVRIRAALALGAALPKSGFEDSQFVVPVLALAVAQSGRETVLIVDSDDANLNRISGEQRNRGREVIALKSFYSGLERVRNEGGVLAGIFIATDITEPGLALALESLRSEFAFTRTPVVLLVRPGQSVMAEEAAKLFTGVERVDAALDDAGLEEALLRGRRYAGQAAFDQALAQRLALEAAEVLRAIAADGRTVYDVGAAEPALIGALSATDEKLQVTAAAVLSLFDSATAQRAIGHVALDAGSSELLRLAAFDSLAASARGYGNRLEEPQISTLIRIVREEPDLTMRTAATKALGALNLATDRASEIIRGYHGG